MIGKQAKVLSANDVSRLLAVARHGRTPKRDRVMVLLSVRAGLRAREIANLTWAMVLDPTGRIDRVIEVRDAIAKRRSGRRVPMHPQLRAALMQLYREQNADYRRPEVTVVRSRKGGALRPNSVVNWFVAACKRAGLAGCSSHSGRRTFITSAARRTHKAGASLRDVQLLAGHRSIETTQRYIDGDSQAQRKLVSLL